MFATIVLFVLVVVAGLLIFFERTASYPDLDMTEFLINALDNKADFAFTGKQDTYIISFNAEDFAPALWAGTEGFTFQLGHNSFKIQEVRFETRELIIKKVQ